MDNALTPEAAAVAAARSEVEVAVHHLAGAEAEGCQHHHTSEPYWAAAGEHPCQEDQHQERPYREEHTTGNRHIHRIHSQLVHQEEGVAAAKEQHQEQFLGQHNHREIRSRNRPLGFAPMGQHRRGRGICSHHVDDNRYLSVARERRHSGAGRAARVSRHDYQGSRGPGRLQYDGAGIRQVRLQTVRS